MVKERIHLFGRVLSPYFAVLQVRLALALSDLQNTGLELKLGLINAFLKHGKFQAVFGLFYRFFL